MALSKIQAESMNLADTYAFTGTVSGASDYVKITETVLSNDATYVSFTSSGSPNIFSSDYKKLHFYFSNWNVTKTTTSFVAMHSENNTIAQSNYDTNYDLAQSTSDQEICQNVYTGNDESVSGIVKLYNPSSTTYVKHFISNTQSYFASSRSWHNLVAGYCNTTSAINGVIFRFDTNNMDDGTIQMFGVK